MRKKLSKFKPDQKDYAMLDLLQKDGRASNVKRANTLNLSEAP